MAKRSRLGRRERELKRAAIKAAQCIQSDDSLKSPLGDKSRGIVMSYKWGYTGVVSQLAVKDGKHEKDRNGHLREVRVSMATQVKRRKTHNTNY